MKVPGALAGDTVSVSACVAVPAALVADSIALEVAAATGTPEIRPLVVFTERPEGRPVAPYAVGEPDATIW